MKLNRRNFLGGIAVGFAAAIPQRLIATPEITARPERLFAAPGAAAMPDKLPEALASLDRHRPMIPRADIIGLADFSHHSGEVRYHIVDIPNGRLIESFLVAHGQGSDPANSGFLQRFSNRPGSNASCSGSFLVGESYFGKHGRSRRLHGLDPENSNARARAIVIHGADYVSADIAERSGRVGRSQGCFAFSRTKIDEVLKLLPPGHFLYATK